MTSPSRSDRPHPGILDEQSCRSFQETVELVGRRWSAAILLAISQGASRFGEIRGRVDGLSDRLLAQRLKELEDERLIERHVIPTTPVQVQYALSERGAALLSALQPLVDWGLRSFS